MFLEEFANKGDAGGRATSCLLHSNSLLGYESAWRDSVRWGVWGRDIRSIPGSGPSNERRDGLSPPNAPLISVVHVLPHSGSSVEP